MGTIGGALGEHFALMSLLLTAVLIVFLNLQTLRTEQTTELTTSAAMLVTCFAGILCGQGHTLVPAAAMVITAALLAWKQPLSGFSLGLTEKELHSALTLAILAIVIYPALPEGTIGPHAFIAPRQAWLTVLLIAGIAPAALISAGVSFISMLIVCALFLLSGIGRHIARAETPDAAPFPLTSPFSLWVAIKYGSFFVFLQVLGNLAQQSAGQGAFYLVSFLGGLASSASSLAAAASLAAHRP